MNAYLRLFILIINFTATAIITAVEFNEIPEEHKLFLRETPCEILGLGAANMDLLIPVNDDFLKNVPGEKGGAQSIEYESFNKIIELSGSIPYIATGGSCANTIKSLASLKVTCGLLNTIGPDDLGKKFIDYMKGIGVVPLLHPSSKPTSRVLCLITPDGQRTMRFFGGSCTEMSEKHLHPDYFRNVKIVHIDAYSLRNKGLVKTFMQMAKEANITVSFDLSSFEIVREFHDTIVELLTNYVDIVFANIDETRALTGLDPHEGCMKLQMMCPIAVVLVDKNGCLVGHEDKIIACKPSYPVNVIDTTGAGDLFASGFLYGYLKKFSLEECASIGNLLGGTIIGVIGTELPEERWEEIRTRIDSLFTTET